MSWNTISSILVSLCLTSHRVFSSHVAEHNVVLPLSHLVSQVIGFINLCPDGLSAISFSCRLNDLCSLPLSVASVLLVYQDFVFVYDVSVRCAIDIGDLSPISFRLIKTVACLVSQIFSRLGLVSTCLTSDPSFSPHVFEWAAISFSSQFALISYWYFPSHSSEHSFVSVLSHFVSSPIGLSCPSSRNPCPSHSRLILSQHTSDFLISRLETQFRPFSSHLVLKSFKISHVSHCWNFVCCEKRLTFQIGYSEPSAKVSVRKSLNRWQHFTSLVSLICRRPWHKFHS